MSKSFVEKNKYAFGMFVFFVVMMALKMPPYNGMSSFSTTIYTATYDIGFSSRFLVGSVIFLFTDFLTLKALYAIIIVSTLIMVALLSFMLGYIPGRLDGAAGSGARAVMLFYAAMPVSVIVLFKDMNFGRYDIYLIIVSMLILVCLSRRQAAWLVPMLCGICMLIHHVWMFSFMPAAAILLIYTAGRGKKKGRGIAVCALSFAVIIGLFIYFQFFKFDPGFATAEEMTAAMSKRVDYGLNSDIFYGEYFSSVQELWASYIKPILIEDSIPDALYLMPVFLPFLAVLYYVWFNAFLLCGEKFMRFVILLCMLSPASTLVQCVMINDYGRWFAAMLITQLSLMFFLAYKDEQAVVGALEKLAGFFKGRPYLAVSAAAVIPIFTFSISYNL